MSSATAATSPVSDLPACWSQTRFGYHFTESSERNGDSPVGHLLSVSEYRGIEVNTRTVGQRASEDVSNYRVVRPGQLAANMMWLNHGGLGVSELLGYISPAYKSFWISDAFASRYVHHLFRSSRYVNYFNAIGSGVRPNSQMVTRTILGMMPVPLPPMTTQRAIADYLDRETGEIDAMIGKLDEMADALRVRVVESIAKELVQVADRRRLRWMVAAINTGPFGTQVKQADYVVDGIPLINPSHLVDGRIVPDSKVAVDEVKAGELERFALQEGDIVVARRGELGRSAVVRSTDLPAICGTGCLRVRAASENALPEYVQLVISSREAVRELSQLSVGATMENLNERILGEVRVPVLTIDEQRELLGRVQAVQEATEAMLAKVAELKELLIERRAALITDVVTGRKVVA